MSVSLPVDAVPGVETLEETAHASLLRGSGGDRKGGLNPFVALLVMFEEPRDWKGAPTRIPSVFGLDPAIGGTKGF